MRSFEGACKRQRPRPVPTFPTGPERAIRSLRLYRRRLRVRTLPEKNAARCSASLSTGAHRLNALRTKPHATTAQHAVATCRRVHSTTKHTAPCEAAAVPSCGGRRLNGARRPRRGKRRGERRDVVVALGNDLVALRECCVLRCTTTSAVRSFSPSHTCTTHAHRTQNTRATAPLHAREHHNPEYRQHGTCKLEAQRGNYVGVARNGGRGGGACGRARHWRGRDILGDCARNKLVA